MNTIVMVYEITELIPIRKCLEEQQVSCEMIRTPEWVKAQDVMSCNTALQVHTTSENIQHLLASKSVVVRGIFDSEKQTA